MKNSLTAKMTFYICGVAFFCFAATITIISYIATKSSEQESLKLVTEMGYRFAEEVASEMEVAAHSSRTLSVSLGGLKENEEHVSRAKVANILKRVLETEDSFWGVWNTWEPNAFDGKDEDYKGTPGTADNGRYAAYWYRSNNEIGLHATETPDSNDSSQVWYYLPISSKKGFITEPTIYEIEGNDVMMVSFCEPILVNGKALGVSGVDFTMDAFMKSFLRLAPMKTAMDFCLPTVVLLLHTLIKN